MKADTLNVILPTIEKNYGHYNESSYDILKDMHDIDKTLEQYRDFVFTKFNYS
jgi:hypothetical protein